MLAIAKAVDMYDVCLVLEQKKFRANSYVPPSRRKPGYVDPDFAFISSETSLSPTINAFPPTVLVSPTVPSSRNPVCWNYQKMGHTRQSCPEPRKLL
ncbi:hypothetical protein HHI36_004948 [Cryptolaemus montrouzieri]|uniref:Uncharacterized protein n=1 Tax=Cryptolaemus montrouzieri TaxID=559131 RepID=A0ABD2NSZ6_9CUCU